MTETDVPEPDYDAMSPSDRAFALFTAVEAARSKAITEMREAGREIDNFAEAEAHLAAAATWKAWAQPLLKERETLEKTGTWKVKRQFSTEFSALIEVGQNTETRDILCRADLNASSITFIGADWHREGKDNGEKKKYLTDTELFEKKILCETIDLRGFSFPANVSFRNAAFMGNTAFIGTALRGSASFKHTIFKSHVFFNSAAFHSDSNFESSAFEGYTSFSSATFKSNTSFHSATFEGNVEFYRTTFNGNADFHSVIFNGYASFTAAIIDGHSKVIDVVFNDDAYFRSTVFNGTTTFRGSTFKNYASFRSAIFKDSADFRQINFLSHANFSETEFSHGSDWTALNAMRAFNMAGARFKTQVPKFIQTHFTESPRVDNIGLPMPQRGERRLPPPQPEARWNTKQVHSWGWAGGATQDDQDSMHSIQAKWEELEEDEELGDAPEGETRREIERDGKPPNPKQASP